VLLKDLGAKQKTIVLHFSAIIMISAYIYEYMHIYNDKYESNEYACILYYSRDWSSDTKSHIV